MTKLTRRFPRGFHRVTIALIMMAVVFMNFPISAFADALSVDLRANGQESLSVSGVENFTVSLASAGATACQLTSPAASGAATNLSMTIETDHPWYPAAGGSTTFTVICTDGSINVSDTVVVSRPASTNTNTNTSTNTNDNSSFNFSNTNSTNTNTNTNTTSNSGFDFSNSSFGFNSTASANTNSTLGADIKVNGSDGPTVSVTSGQSYTYSWSSSGATACQLTSPAASGISLSGSGSIESTHPWYPTANNSVTYTIICTNGSTNASDSVTVVLAGSNPPPTNTTVGAMTVDIDANGSDGPVTLTSATAPLSITWSSTGATACQLTSPAASGISLNGTSNIESTHPWYPVTGPVTFTIICTQGTTNVTDSVTIHPFSATNTVVPGALSADIKINGLDGHVTIRQGEHYIYSWSSNGATACQLTTPAASGISRSGTGAPITPDHPWYPALGQTVTYTIICTNGTTNATDSVSVSVVAPGVSTVCVLLTDYMRIDFQNNPDQVRRLQTFLRDTAGYSYVSVTGVFDQATFNAVSAFQVRYFNDILAPWGHSDSTGYVYILTLKKINEIHCGQAININPSQNIEIQTFRTIVFTPGLPSTGLGGGAAELALLESGDRLAQGLDKGQNIFRDRTLTIPSGEQILETLYALAVILLVLYILGNVLKNVFYKPEQNVLDKEFYTRWSAMSGGLVVALFLSHIFGWTNLILPLLIILFLSILWIFLYPKHGEIKSGVRSWKDDMGKFPPKNETAVSK